MQTKAGRQARGAEVGFCAVGVWGGDDLALGQGGCRVVSEEGERERGREEEREEVEEEFSESQGNLSAASMLRLSQQRSECRGWSVLGCSVWEHSGAMGGGSWFLGQEE